MCRKSHAVPLHEDCSPAGTLSTQGTAEENTSSSSCCGGEGGNTSMIVPVWISALSAHTLLDTKSSQTFVNQKVCEKLQATMEPVKLKLSIMMGKDSIVKSQSVCERNVRRFSSNISISFPSACLQPTQEISFLVTVHLFPLVRQPTNENTLST